MDVDAARRKFTSNVSRFSTQEESLAVNDVYINRGGENKNYPHRQSLYKENKAAVCCFFLLILFGAMLRFSSSRIFGKNRDNRDDQAPSSERRNSSRDISTPRTPAPSPRTDEDLVEMDYTPMGVKSSDV